MAEQERSEAQLGRELLSLTDAVKNIRKRHLGQKPGRRSHAEEEGLGGLKQQCESLGTGNDLSRSEN